MKAIVAMSENRAIGRNKKLPWHLPKELEWFNGQTTGGAVVMGRKTYEGMPSLLPNRVHYIVSRTMEPPDEPEVHLLRSVEEVEDIDTDLEIWICGGEEIYRRCMPLCSDLYLTIVKRQVPDADAFFPRLEDDLDLVGKIRETEAFDIYHYRNPNIVASIKGDG